MLNREYEVSLIRHVRTYDAFLQSDVTFAVETSNTQSASVPTSFRQNLISFCIVFATIFHMTTQCSVYYNSLWPFLNTLDPEASETFYGSMFTVYHICGAVASPIFGWISNRVSVKLPILAGLLLIATSNLMMFFAYVCPVHRRKWLLFTSRMVAGTGTGSFATLFAYTVAAAAVNERGLVVTLRTIVEVTAMMLGPLIQTACVPAGFSETNFGLIRVNMYTLPPMISFVTTILIGSVVCVFFKDFYLSEEESEDDVGLGLVTVDKTALLVSSYVRTVNTFIVNATWAVSTPVAMVLFGWSASEAVWNTSIFYSVQGLIILPFNFLVGYLSTKHVRERALMLFGICVVIVAVLVAFPWPWYPSVVPWESFDHKHLESFDQFNTTDAKYAYYTCTFSWCKGMPKMYIGCSVAFIILIYVSHETIKIPSAVLFANILGPKSQGTWQGLYSCFEMLGYGLGPVAVNYVFQAFGPQIMFLFITIMVVPTMMAQILTYKRLISWYEVTKATSSYVINKWG